MVEQRLSESAESRIPPALAVVLAAVLYARLPDKYIVSGNIPVLGVARFVLPTLEILLLAPLFLVAPRSQLLGRFWHRRVVLGLIGLISLANAASMILLVHLIITGHKLGGHELVLASIDIWWTNVIVFSLWFWQLDGGGPLKRRAEQPGYERDFLFPQMESPAFAPPGWRPNYLDYLYTSFTNAAAFSPTDVLPLTRLAKMLMLAESAASLLTLLMVASRAVNILGT
jgi:hypothetical protein